MKDKIFESKIKKLLKDSIDKIKSEEVKGAVRGSVIKTLAYAWAEAKVYWVSRKYMRNEVKSLFDEAEQLLKKYRHTKYAMNLVKEIRKFRYLNLRDSIRDDVKLARKILKEGGSLFDVFDDPQSYCARCG